MTAHRTIEKHTVAELMTRDLLTIAADESVLMAWELMCQAGVHHLPVVQADGRLVGVVDAPTLTSMWESAGPLRSRRAVASLLPSGAPASVRPATTVPEAARAMLKAEKDYVPVSDEHGALVGLLTAHDLISALAGLHREARPRRAGMPSLYRIDPILPSRSPRPGHTTIPPD